MKNLITLSLIFVLIMFIPTQVSAQRGPGQGSELVDQLREQLERTDEIMDHAREIIRECRSETAHMLMDQALGMQQRAWEQFRKSNADAYRRAAGLTVRARELAQEAIANCRFSKPTEQNNDVVLRNLERVTEMMDRLRDAAPEDIPQQLQALYRSARENLNRAWEFYRTGRYRPALALCNQVEKTIQKILSGNSRSNTLATLERRFENMRGLLDRLQDAAADCESEDGVRLMRQAEEAFQRAQNFMTEGNVDAARHTLLNAQRLANMVAEECRVQNRFEQYERVKEQADRLNEQIDPGDDKAMMLMRQVREQLELCHRYLEGDQPREASAALRAAQMVLQQLKRHLRNEG